ncbi:ENV7 [Candida pseudojiufengensis]|uniref:ENV7 n=1 Tax=Candida pseudojiufengensis TaxID=497109 RepID=UPI0022251B8D|nr:ENV7 [Candida pseudojiufengensis]KAI5959785.1 ENV7 [Candida pseudojiufengensis]
MTSILSLFSSCLPCFPFVSGSYIKINGVTYSIIRLLGEGGFSYVYLVNQINSSSSGQPSPYALKQINCLFGTEDESFRNATREIKNYHRFLNYKTPYIIQSIEEQIISNPDGSIRINILLPYFTTSLQEIINENVLNNTKLDEKDILKYFIGICRGLKIMHNYKQTTRNVGNLDNDEDLDDDIEEQDTLLNPPDDEFDVESNANTAGGARSNTELQELIPFAHHDLKPANVMLSAEGLPVLVDLGSCSKARYNIRTRQQALSLTDFAQEHCTLPYRAPELLDVETGSQITEATDIWSLGCLLYCCCFGYSPFEKLEIDQGANLNLAIAQGKYQIPEDQNGYSDELVGLIRKSLQVKAKNRPKVEELLEEALKIGN